MKTGTTTEIEGEPSAGAGTLTRSPSSCGVKFIVRLAYPKLPRAVRRRLAIERPLPGHLPLEPGEAKDLLKDIFGALGLQAFDREFDDLICTFLARLTDDRLRDQMLTDYVGFPVFDVLLMSPASLEGGPDPLTPISVERISPEDAPTLKSIFEGLKSRQFMGFLGFFNRAYREHDYLWGRLNAADRLVDLLLQSSRDAISDPERMRLKLFRAVIDRERRQLYRCDDELERIDAFLKAAGA